MFFLFDSCVEEKEKIIFFDCPVSLSSVKREGKNNKGGLKAYANGLLTLDGVLTLDEWNEDRIVERSKRQAEVTCRVWKG